MFPQRTIQHTLPTMVSNQELVYNLRLSSVGPGTSTGQDVSHHPTNADLAVKLHYVRLVHYFAGEAVEGLGIRDYKAAMFAWLDRFYAACGRLRRGESGRAYVKCNDCGARMIEAECGKRLEEWLEIKDGASENLLVYGQVIGPEINFSPLVLLQLTTFKCGGISLGLSWAHILGDPFVAAEFMATLGHVLSGRKLTQLYKHIPIHNGPKLPQSPINDPLSLKRVGPVGDLWKITNNCKMEIFSFNLSAKQITKLCGKVSGKFPAFESVCAVVWKCVAKVRLGPEPKLVTICKNGTTSGKSNILGNGQVISVARAGFHVADASLDEIGEWLGSRTDDIPNIDKVIERDQGLSDFILYGANLTFLDLEGANIYGFEIRGNKPVYASCTIDGVGENGVVLVIPDGKYGKVVTLIMPENEVSELKSELDKEF